MLKLNNVHKIFNYGRINENHALKDISLVVPKGDFITIIGSNGAGKSTLLNLVAGTCFPESGTVEINGQDMTNWPVHKRSHLVGRVFQDPEGDGGRDDD